MEDARAIALAAVAREVEETDALIAAGRNLPPRAGRADQLGSRSSTVFTLRLDAYELRALHGRALVMGIKPSVLARNYIRVGLARPTDSDIAAAVGQLGEAVARLRELTG